MIVAGIGCRRGVGADEILAAVDAALDAARLRRDDLCAVATAELKAGEPALAAAAAMLGVPLTIVAEAALQAADGDVPTRSDAALAVAGVGSVAEAAALAAAGAGARLIVRRIVSGRVTCAIASSGGRS